MIFFCRIPNLCSSSITTSPVFLKLMSLLKIEWVPIRISILLLLKSSIIRFLFLDDVCLLSSLILTGTFLNLLRKDS